MITAVIIDGVGKIAWVRKLHANTKRMVCRIYSFTDSRIPENVLNEIIPGTGVFKDPVSKERFRMINHTLKPI